MVLSSLEEFSTVCFDPHNGFNTGNEAGVLFFRNSIAFSMIQ